MDLLDPVPVPVRVPLVPAAISEDLWRSLWRDHLLSLPIGPSVHEPSSVGKRLGETRIDETT